MRQKKKTLKRYILVDICYCIRSSKNLEQLESVNLLNGCYEANDCSGSVED